jgi:hypothetical protein
VLWFSTAAASTGIAVGLVCVTGIAISFLTVSASMGIASQQNVKTVLRDTQRSLWMMAVVWLDVNLTVRGSPALMMMIATRVAFVLMVDAFLLVMRFSALTVSASAETILCTTLRILTNQQGHIQHMKLAVCRLTKMESFADVDLPARTAVIAYHQKLKLILKIIKNVVLSAVILMIQAVAVTTK